MKRLLIIVALMVGCGTLALMLTLLLWGCGKPKAADVSGTLPVAIGGYGFDTTSCKVGKIIVVDEATGKWKCADPPTITYGANSPAVTGSGNNIVIDDDSKVTDCLHDGKHWKPRDGVCYSIDAPK